MENFTRKAVVSLLSSYISQFATTAVNFASKLILARLIAPADLGLYAVTLIVLLGSDVLVDLGVAQHLAREKHRPYGNVLMLRTSISVVLFIALQIFAGEFRFLGAQVPAVLRTLAILVVIKAIAGLALIFLDRELMINKSILPQFARLAATAIVSIGLGFMHYGVWALVYGTIVGEAVFGIMIWRAAYPHMPLELTWKYTGSLLRGSQYLFLIGCMGFALQQGDIGVIGTLKGVQQTGYYAMAYTLVVIISRVVEVAIYRVIYPMFCEYRDDIPRLGMIYRKATLAITAIEAPIYFFLLFNSPILVTAVLGKKWMPAAILMQYLAVSGIINPFSTFGMEVLRAKRKDRILTLSTVLGAITLVTFGYILTSRYGTVGMAMANYIIIGSIPTIIAVYKTVRSDFIKLAGQLAIVYITSFAIIATAGITLSSHPVAQIIVSGILVPTCWLMYYKAYGDDLGRKTINVLLSPRSAA